MATSGCLVMFKQNNAEHLGLMYRLFKLGSTSLTCILLKMQSYIVEKGKVIVSDPEYVKNPVVFTKKLLEFKKEIDNLVD